MREEILQKEQKLLKRDFEYISEILDDVEQDQIIRFIIVYLAMMNQDNSETFQDLIEIVRKVHIERSIGE